MKVKQRQPYINKNGDNSFLSYPQLQKRPGKVFELRVSGSAE